MTTKLWQKYCLTFTPLTPIHIGCGEEIDPLEYKIIRTEKGSNRLYRLNLPAMIESLNTPKREEFLRLLDGRDLIAIRKFVETNADIKQHRFYESVVTEPVYKVYQKNVMNVNNALRIDPMYRRRDTWQAVIPGSSIKGAIRTAILSAEMRVAYEKDKWVPDFKKPKWENIVLFSENPNDDPFRALQIEDVTLPPDAIMIDEVKMIRRKPQNTAQNNPAGIQQFYEMTFCYLDGEEELDGFGELSIQLHLQEKLSEQNDLYLKFTIEDIVSSCRRFYQKRMKDEHETFYRWQEEDIKNASEQLLNIAYEENEFPIRLGHFSHCESVTVDLEVSGKPVRRPKTRYNKQRQPLPFGTTRTLAGGLYPMGWAKISLKEDVG
jgi:CRISPR-associated protein Csm5